MNYAKPYPILSHACACFSYHYSCHVFIKSSVVKKEHDCRKSSIMSPGPFLCLVLFLPAGRSSTEIPASNVETRVYAISFLPFGLTFSRVKFICNFSTANYKLHVQPQNKHHKVLGINNGIII